MKYKLSYGSVNGADYERLEFESHAGLEEYFLENLWGKKGIRSKVIGLVLLVSKK
ncbi:hypothetical protein UFOVP847_5 [uncultured Caudovirales phage]|uniref:Uncharacterized protein n=1 Tax=uncultured Caudovirales phage TaxID=2100421 RepID=A0A6J5PEH4_9CAUD|nr:hypothetical protein UFOVP847_5 [uncultured Caudovirales phage]